MGRIIARGKTPQDVIEIAKLRGYSPSEIKIISSDNAPSPSKTKNKNNYVNRRFDLRRR
jgi:hypothetical protein